MFSDGINENEFGRFHLIIHGRLTEFDYKNEDDYGIFIKNGFSCQVISWLKYCYWKFVIKKYFSK